MKFNCEIDNVKTLKKGMKITLAISEKDTINVMKNIYSFIDRSITVDLLVDADKEKEKLDWITPEQRRKIFALIKDISIATGEDKENLRKIVQDRFIQATEYEEFSLSNCSKGLAKDFIEYLIVLAFELGVNFTEHPTKGMGDIEGYLQICIKTKKCCVCGEGAEIHHVDAIGMGRNRNLVDDGNNRKMALCREHHSEYHNIGIENFDSKYHVYGVVGD